MRRAVWIVLLPLGACSCEDGSLMTLHAELTVEPAEINFGILEPGEEASREIKLIHSGNRPINIKRVVIERETAELGVSTAPRRLDPEIRASLAVHYLPRAAGLHDNALLIETDADQGASFRIPITAQAIDPCADNDGDTFGEHCTPGDDCNDLDREIHPGAIERCNGRDDNCDRNADEGLNLGDRCIQVVDLAAGPCSRPGTTICDARGEGTTCDPIAVNEACDGLDNDCNGTADDPFLTQLNQPCLVPDGACQRPGVTSCAPGGAGTFCMADMTMPPQCCPAGQAENAAGQCCTSLPAGPCSQQCSLDLGTGVHNCSGPITVTEVSGGRALVQIDMTGSTSLELQVDGCDFSGNWLDVADSPTCNGFGGDGATTSNNAEAHASDTSFAIFANDFVAPPETSPLTTINYPTTGCGPRTFSIADRRVQMFDPCFDHTSDYALRINPPLDTEGTPDAIWYIGLNRVVAEAVSRIGQGVQSASFCLR